MCGGGRADRKRAGIAGWKVGGCWSVVSVKMLTLNGGDESDRKSWEGVQYDEWKTIG